jgi:uncharacterized membrane protein YphA (DoxX/SURF4 family)
MTLALIIFSSLLAFAAIGSAISKLKRVPDVMAAMEKVGVKPHLVPALATLETAGGLGVILGIWSKFFGLCTPTSHVSIRLQILVLRLESSLSP